MDENGKNLPKVVEAKIERGEFVDNNNDLRKDLISQVNIDYGEITDEGGKPLTEIDEDGNDVGEGAAALAKIEVIRTENKNPLLSGAKFQIACDVKNPLCGKQGATYIFGPQKGVTEEQKEQVDEAMRHYADVTKESLDCDFADCEGAGAAGGLGYAFLSYLAGELIQIGRAHV